MKKAFTLVEVIMASMLAAIAFGVLYSSFSRSAQLASKTRNRTAAMLLADTVLEEVREHRYGAPLPPWWAGPPAAPVEVWVEGRQQHVAFTREIQFENGSFVGRSPGDTDRVRVTISWGEPGGARSVEVAVPVAREVWR